MKLERKDVLHIARLARLRLDEDEATLYGEQLSHILDYVERLAALDVADVPPTFHVEDVSAPLRPDEPAPNQTTDEALANAPARSGTAFSVPKVIDA